MCGKCYPLVGLVDRMAGKFWLQRHFGTVLASYLSFLVISNTITALIAVERCLCVLRPLKAAKIFKTKHMGMGIMAVAIFSLVVENITLCQKYLTVQVTNPITNTSVFISRLSQVYLNNRILTDIFDLYLLSVTAPLVSLIVVIVCTTAIIVRLKVTATWRRTVSSMTSAERQEMAVTRMLVTVCCMYVVCMIPSMTRALLLFGRVPGYMITGFRCSLFRTSISFSHLLEAVNASVNFLIYVKQSSHYRSTLKRLCHCVARHQNTNKSRST